MIFVISSSIRFDVACAELSLTLITNIHLGAVPLRLWLSAVMNVSERYLSFHIYL